MSGEVFIKGFFVALISSFFSWIVFTRYDEDIGDEITEAGRQRYMPYLPALLLPILLDVLFLLSLPRYGVLETLEQLLPLCLGVFTHISIYYLLLALLLPLLRNWITARTCAMLWIMPNYLYFVMADSMSAGAPQMVIHMERMVYHILLWIWLAGAAAVMLWKLGEHLAFRHRILDRAQPVTDPQILAVWQQELEDARIRKPKYRLVTSSHVSAPLSIGFFARTTRVILPRKSYDEASLKLILRHELIHICREDSSNKFFLVFCAAMCWFNPLMWLALRRSTEDLELSCDETVLLDADESQRRSYAALVLNTAGSGKGFTSCLSASASALRYRLKHIVKPRKLHSGALIIGLVFFLLCMTCGRFAIAYDSMTGAQVLFGTAEEPGYRGDMLYTIENINYYQEDTQYLECRSQDEVLTFLGQLQVCSLAGSYIQEEIGGKMILIIRGPESSFGVTLQDHLLTVTPLAEGENSRSYYIPEPVNWEALLTLLRSPET